MSEQIIPEGRAHTPEQKREVIERLYQAWLKRPELRLSQLILNVYVGDFYYVEDRDFIDSIESFYERIDEGR